jgi:hypothetical protein
MKFIRDFVAEVSNNPTMYPPDRTMVLDSAGSGVDLSAGFVAKVYRREAGSSKDVSLSDLPVVLVTTVCRDMIKCNDRSVLKYSLSVSDKDNDFISVKVDTCINDQMGLVTAGMVLRLLRFDPLYTTSSRKLV